MSGIAISLEPKSELNQFCQRIWQAPPQYQSTRTGGSPNNPSWRVIVTLPDARNFNVDNVAGSLANAEKAVARIALQTLEQSGELLASSSPAKANRSKQNSTSSTSSSSSSSNVSLNNVSSTSNSNNVSSLPSSNTTPTIPVPIAATTISSRQKPIVVPTPFNNVAEQTPKNNHLLVLSKVLDIFRSALVRPLRAELVRLLGDSNWLTTIKSEKKISPTARSNIDESMMNWDAMAVCSVSLWLLKKLQFREKQTLLETILAGVRHRVAHFHANTNTLFNDWSTCRVLIKNTITYLEWWNVNFTNKVERGFIRQLNDICVAADASLIEPPLIDRSEIVLGDEFARGSYASVLAAKYRNEDVAVKKFSHTTMSPTIEHSIRKEIQTMVSGFSVFFLKNYYYFSPFSSTSLSFFSFG